MFDACQERIHESRRYRGVVCIVLFLALMMCERCFAGSIAEDAAKKLAWEVESRRSVDMRTKTKPTNNSLNSGEEPLFNTYEEHYIETAAGKRFGEFVGMMDDVVTARWQDFGDGSRCAHVDFDRGDTDLQKTVAITRQYWREDQSDRKTIPAPLLYLYVGREPLQKMLLNAEILGESRVLDRQCDRFLFRSVRWPIVQDQVFHLDRATAMPLKVAAYKDNAARLQEEPLWEWTAESLDTVEGHPVTLKSTLVAYGASRKASYIWETQVESITFDKFHPDTGFWPIIQPTATVFNSLDGSVRNGKGLKPPKTDVPSGSAGPPTASDAVPPTTWTDFLPVTTLLLGCTMFATAGIFWWRRR